jgi:hypothetical protein
MTLAVDSSTPAVKLSGFLGSTPETQASNSFSPPAGSVITAVSWASDSFDNDWAASYPQITDSLATHLTWNLVVAAYSNGASARTNRIALWWAYAGVSAPGSMTVSVTEETTSGQYIEGMGVACRVWDGASITAPVSSATVSGVTAAGTSTGTISITPTVTGSALLMAAGNVVGSTGTNGVGSGCYLCDNAGTSPNTLGSGQLWVGTSSGPTPTTSLTPVSLSMSDTTSAPWTYLAYEVVPPAAAAAAGRPLAVYQPAVLRSYFI